MWVKIPKRYWFAPARISIAITLYPFVFVRSDYWDDPGLRAHERYHLWDIKRTGVLRWYLKYLWYFPRYGGGRRHPLERMAYHLQDKINQFDQTTN